MEVVSTLLKLLFHSVGEMKMRYDCYSHTSVSNPFLVGWESKVPYQVT